jgi:hypothetical protein
MTRTTRVATNDLFRERVTNTAFNLRLTKTQLWTLVGLDTLGGEAFFATPASRFWTGHAEAMYATGLVTHDEQWTRKKGRLTRNHRLTPTGRVVVELLKHAGLYDEVLEQMGVAA